MKELKINKIKIQNFKGVSELEMEFSENRTDVFGMNGSGKTTLADAFAWVLWNKDSKGNAPGTDNFHDKPLDEDGNEVHNIDTDVYLFCTLDGKPFNVHKNKRENWVKKRGASEAVYSGNVSTYFINDVEIKVSDFNKKISEICPEEVFQQIACLSAFCMMDWKKRRERLLEISGTDVDGQLLEMERYRPLADEVGQRGICIDDLKKVLNDQRKRTNEQLKMIPVRIDEARKNLPQLTEREIKDAAYIITDSLADIERINDQIAALKMSNGNSNSRMKVLELEQELITIKRRVAMEFETQKQSLNRQALDASNEVKRASSNRVSCQQDMEKAMKKHDEAVAKREELRQQFMNIRNEVISVDTDCPYCGQHLPDDKIQAAQERAEAVKKSKLNKIREEGKKITETVDYFENYIADMEKEVSEAEKRVSNAIAERDEIFGKLNQIGTVDYSAEPRIAELESQIEAAKAEQKSSPDENILALEKRKNELLAKVEEKRAIIAKRDSGLETEKRIAELEAEQKELGAQVSEIETLIMLLEQFVIERCKCIENSINAKFPKIRWKLFDVQINGGIVDCCECMIPCESGLVSYSSANTAAQINADIEIINVLSDFYGVKIPLFIDNAERVNVLEEANTQVITLSVSSDVCLMVKEGVI